MSVRVLTCTDHNVSWLHEDDRFDDPRWDPVLLDEDHPGTAAYLRAKCPMGHWASAHVGFRFDGAHTTTSEAAALWVAAGKLTRRSSK